MRKFLVMMLCCLVFVACPPQVPEGYKPETPVPGAVQEQSDLFVAGAEGVVRFKTNANQHYSSRGFTLWGLAPQAETVFENREVELTKFSGNSTAGYGLVCCYKNTVESGDTMLLVLINIEKEYTVLEKTGALWEELVGWRESQFLQAGYNQRNRLRLEYRSGSREYLLLINGELESTFKDEQAPFHTEGREGYAVIISPLDNFPAVPVEVQFKEEIIQ